MTAHLRSAAETIVVRRSRSPMTALSDARTSAAARFCPLMSRPAKKPTITSSALGVRPTPAPTRSAATACNRPVRPASESRRHVHAAQLDRPYAELSSAIDPAHPGITATGSDSVVRPRNVEPSSVRVVPSSVMACPTFSRAKAKSALTHENGNAGTDG